MHVGGATNAHLRWGKAVGLQLGDGLSRHAVPGIVEFSRIRAVPHFEGGQSTGFRLFAIRQGSLFDKIGLKNGDILNIDVTVIKDGYHGDTSRMFFVGEPAPIAERVTQVCFEAMWRGIRAVRPGARLGDIGHAIQTYAEGHRFSVVREYCGHGIGRVFHEDPQVLHYGRPGEGLVFQPGMTFTIEPMINEGTRFTRLLPDGWTVVTKDRKLSAQWEHTVLVTDDGVEILTRLPGDDNDL